MFTVPGWKVPQIGPVQEQPKSQQHSLRSEATSKTSNHSKKRKRNANGATDQQPQSQIDRLNRFNPAQDASDGHKKNRRRTGGEVGARDVRVGSKVRSNPAWNSSTTPNHLRLGGEHPSAGISKRDTIRHEASKEAAPKRSSVGKSSTAPPTLPRFTPEAAHPSMIPPSLPPQATNLTPLQIKMRDKLTSARFRHLNETLYTTSSSEALQLFANSPDLFSDYHAGFSQQVRDSWPQNPVRNYIRTLNARAALTQPKNGLTPLPRRKTGSCTIADLGCGDAAIARECQPISKKFNVKFHSYDLQAANSSVTVADIANLPLRDGEADIAVFCLSLMGTNWIEFVEEAWRILRGDGKGEVWVAEVKSRFGRTTQGRVVDNSVGKKRKKQKHRKADEEDSDHAEPHLVEDERTADQQVDETDVSKFVKVFQRRGFALKEDSVDKTNKMFVSMVFLKSGIPATGKHKGKKWNGKEYQRIEDMVRQRPRFVGGQNGNREDEELGLEEETKILKPCVYKTR